MERVFFEEQLMATQVVDISQPLELRTKFEVELPDELAASLREWFEKCRGGDCEVRNI